MAKYIKSEKYSGVAQRQNGRWFFRVKITLPNGKVKYIQKSGFESEELANQVKITVIRLEAAAYGDEERVMLAANSNENTYVWDAYSQNTSVNEMFALFLESLSSEATKKKYASLYNAHIKDAIGKRDVHTICEAELDVLLLRLKHKKHYSEKEGKATFYSESYHDSIRKMLTVFFGFASTKEMRISRGTVKTLARYGKLRVLSLFSGIGAPEQALKNLGYPYELINFCEVDDTAARAYCLLHDVDASKRIKDVWSIDSEYCWRTLPNFDLMIFGFPCQDVSTEGRRKGISVNHEVPCYGNLKVDDIKRESLTRTGLFYRALQIAIWKKPKFMIAENVRGLLSPQNDSEFQGMLRNLQDAGYNIFFKTVNSKNFGVPQNRPRVFMIMIRSDLKLRFSIPMGLLECPKAEDWFEKEVPDYYFLTPEKAERVRKKEEQHRTGEKGHSPNFKTDVISCLTTHCGEISPDYPNTYVAVGDRIRCLTSEELFRFQGFPAEYGTKLLGAGFTHKQIGKMIGNSITVPVIQTILEQLLSESESINTEVVPKQIIQAKERREIIQPLFAYAGNKRTLLENLVYLSQVDFRLVDAIFVDLFGGSGVVAVNTEIGSGNIILNELNPFLLNIYKALSKTKPEKAWSLVLQIITKYDLSSGVKENFYRCRDDYNSVPYEERITKYWYWGLALQMHSFNNGMYVNWNKNGEYTCTAGKKCDIHSIENRFFPFAEKLYNSNIKFTCQSYKEFLKLHLRADEPVFFYADPPYLASGVDYKSGWGEEQERELLDFLDECSARGIRWILSNVLENNGKKNTILIDWLRNREYAVYYLDKDYDGCSYNRKSEGATVEVAVRNYFLD